MGLAVIAEPDPRERVRCVRIIANQTSLSAIGAASWDELETAFEDEPSAELILFNKSLPGSPPDAIERLLSRTQRLVIAHDRDGDGDGDDDEETAATPGLTWAARPIAEETLVMMARMLGRPTTPVPMSFMPVDFLQMVCMSGDSQVFVLSRDGKDAGVIEVRAGEVWTAFDGMGAGEEAFARLIRPEMRARVSTRRGSAKERTIFKGLHELVLESLRRTDEGLVPLAPEISAVELELALSSPEQIASRIHELSAEARRLLMERNYEEASVALIRLSELDPASQLVRANLEQLRRLGYPKS